MSRLRKSTLLKRRSRALTGFLLVDNVGSVEIPDQEHESNDDEEDAEQGDEENEDMKIPRQI